jgi:hypothetical protein
VLISVLGVFSGVVVTRVIRGVVDDLSVGFDAPLLGEQLVEHLA